MSFPYHYQSTGNQSTGNQSMPKPKQLPAISSSSKSIEITCPICGKTFADLRTVEIHLDSSHYKSSSSESSRMNNPFANLLDSTKKLFQGSSGGSITDLRGKGKSTNTILQDVIQGKDIFELNENPIDLVLNGLSDEEYEKFIQLPDHIKQGDLGHWIKKSHWKSGQDTCSIDGCGLSLGLINGRANCFRCGAEVCNDHYRFQARLSVNAHFDPVNGIWARICLKCHQNRIGFKQSLGVMRSRMASFIQMRKVKAAQCLMEVNKTEIRLKKISNLSKRKQFSLLESIPLLSNLIIKDEHDIPWESDSSKSNCSKCNTMFTLINRRHHCRLCGLLICQSCSRATTLTTGERVRSCSDCDHYLYIGKSRQDIIHTPHVITLYNSYTRFKELIQNKLSTFNALLLDIQPRIEQLTHQDQDFILALRLRKDLLDLFAQVDQIGKQIINDGTKLLPGSLSRRLHESIYLSILHYLQMNMFTLQLLPSLSKLKPLDELGKKVKVDDITGQAILDSIRQFENDKERIKTEGDAIRVIEEQIEQLKEELQRHLARQ